MKYKFILISSGIIAVLLLFLLGRTTENKSLPTKESSPLSGSFDISTYINKEKNKLGLTSRKLTDSLEQVLNKTKDSEKSLIYNKLASIWKDSSQNPEIFAYYLSEAAKLDNSEKSLTFAAQLSVDVLRSQKDESSVNWLSSQSIDLFERAIRLNPENEDLKVGLGSAYIFGKGRTGHPEETMKGIMQLLEVAKRDSNNMKAQLMLGIGGFVSGQYDKALVRLQKVVAAEPDNLEAVAFLADTYAAAGKKEEAIKWYTVSKRLANSPAYSREVDERIITLR
jgi:tetratricopeptide (TPR) repeat protein